MRLADLVAAVEAQWADPDTRWLVGHEFLHAHEGALNRIVVLPRSATVRTPSMAAQGHRLADLEPHAAAASSDARDDLVWERRVVIEWHVWGVSTTDAEARVHALLVALAVAAGTADIEIDEVSEEWLAIGEVTTGGAAIVLSTTISIYVLGQDRLIPVTPGESVDIDQVADVSIPMIHDVVPPETVYTILEPPVT